VKSLPVQLLDLVWRGANEATSHSWERLNQSMRAALELGVGSGRTFAPDDFTYILNSYRTGRWIGESAEWFYALAIQVSNKSAIDSFERHYRRGPFVADCVRVGGAGGFTHGGGGPRQRERLAVGFSFPWKGETVTVTSFAEDSSYLTACAYAGEKRKPAARFRITPADIKADRAERKAAGEGA
jgi:hypothetical protein